MMRCFFHNLLQIIIIQQCARFMIKRMRDAYGNNKRMQYKL